MRLLHLFIISLVTFYLFKFVAPIVFNYVADVTISNALLFALVFMIVLKINDSTKALEQIPL